MSSKLGLGYLSKFRFKCPTQDWGPLMPKSGQLLPVTICLQIEGSLRSWMWQNPSIVSNGNLLLIEARSWDFYQLMLHLNLNRDKNRVFCIPAVGLIEGGIEHASAIQVHWKFTHDMASGLSLLPSLIPSEDSELMWRHWDKSRAVLQVNFWFWSPSADSGGQDFEQGVLSPILPKVWYYKLWDLYCLNSVLSSGVTKGWGW